MVAMGGIEPPTPTRYECCALTSELHSQSLNDNLKIRRVNNF